MQKRFLVADAGTLHTEVVLVSERDIDARRWVFVDCGVFGGLAETLGEVIRIASTGAYTTSYSAIGFNGFAPLAQGYINIVAMKEPTV